MKLLRFATAQSLIWITIGMLCFLLTLFVSSILINIFLLGIRTYGISSDFRPFYTAGIMVLHGVKTNFYTYDAQFVWQKLIVTHLTSEKQLMPFFYPPAFAIVFALFTLFPFTIAYEIWLCLLGLLLGILIYGSFLLLPRYTTAKKLLLFLAIITYAPIIITFVQAQVSYILSAAFLFSRLLFLRHKPFAAGFVLCLLAIKPQYIILPLLFLLWKRYDRAFWGFIAGLFVVLCLSLMAIGVTGINQYVLFLAGASQGNQFSIPHDANPTLEGFLLTILPKDKFPDMWFAAAVLFLSISVFVLRQKEAFTNHEFDFQWALLIVATIVVSPYTNFQDLSMLLIAGLCLIRWAHNKSQYIQFIITFIIVGGYIITLLSSFIVKVYHIQILVPYLIVLVIAFALYASSKKTTILQTSREQKKILLKEIQRRGWDSNPR